MTYTVPQLPEQHTLLTYKQQRTCNPQFSEFFKTDAPHLPEAGTYTPPKNKTVVQCHENNAWTNGDFSKEELQLPEDSPVTFTELLLSNLTPASYPASPNYSSISLINVIWMCSKGMEEICIKPSQYPSVPRNQFVFP